MTDFLLELRSEEIPARMQDRAREDLERLFCDYLPDGVQPSMVTTYSTPRRLALIARDLPAVTPSRRSERKGPRADAPESAIAGFLKTTGLTRDQLEERTDSRGSTTLFAVKDIPGEPMPDALKLAIALIVQDFPWPKTMRWGDASASMEALRWVRPLQGIVALFGDAIVECEVSGIVSGAATLGHRFHHPGVITIGSASDYVEKLRACHVVVDQDERRQIIALGATMAARKAGLELIQDDGLLGENAGLTEWPVPLLGRFDAAFLDVPAEVIQLTARVNQKYFVCRDAEGKLANAFVCTANIDAADGGQKIVDGNRKVLAARLSDAKFFYDTDLKVPLDEQARKLNQIVFHEKLGTVADKVDRVAKLARWLVEEGIVTNKKPLPLGGGVGVGQSSNAGLGETSPTPSPSPEGEGLIELADQADRAARLCKADLVTGMVGEFPELQGLMGGYYAFAQGEDAEVAEAIRDHYKPVGQGDAVPTAPVTVAVSLADKLDTLFGFFSRDLKPTGSKDPFALRRAMLGVLSLIEGNTLRSEFRALTFAAGRGHMSTFGTGHTALLEFAIDRLKVQQREAGVRHDLIDAVFAAKDQGGGGEDDLVRLLARVHALQAFVGTSDGANLLAGYKRAANILKKEGVPSSPSPLRGGGQSQAPSSETGTAPLPDPLPASGERGKNVLSYTPEKDEAALILALDSAAPRAADAVEREDFAGAMAALASLRAPIDAFFETVTVNDPDPAKRVARLALLARVRTAVHEVADFSKIEG